MVFHNLVINHLLTIFFKGLKGVCSLLLVKLLHEAFLRDEGLDLELHFLGGHQMIMILLPLTKQLCLPSDKFLESLMQFAKLLLKHVELSF